jgi:ubiquitin-activating enzyme E1
MNNPIDISLYDRQIRTYGLVAIEKITTSSVLIVGLAKGLGTEIAKNLALGGINNIYLYDNNIITKDDLETGFYYTTEDLNQQRAKVLVYKLQELNSYVNIYDVTTYEKGQHVTIVINQPIKLINEINNYCQHNNSKLIVLFSKSIEGVIFVDAGINHIVNDTTGEIIDPVQIGNITLDGIIHCTQNSSHDFQTGDYIKFDNLEGNNLQQFEGEYKIKVLNKFSFQIEKTNIIPFTFINGTAIHIKKPYKILHQNWNEQIVNPTISHSNDIEYDKKLITSYLNNNILYDFEIIPVVSLLGSLTASETIKLVTNKYMPINQWFCWYDHTLLSQIKTDPEGKTTYGKLWGVDFENKLFNSKWFVVGAGAIGCEHLKNLAFMNVANSKLGNGKIIITDPDSIEKSNLNRQFLFRKQHIGKLKSDIASKTIKSMKPEINIKSSSQKVGSDNLEFTIQIMESGITGVLNALDNIQARRFMDDMCFKYNLPLFESGTSGTKGNTQPIIPFITETYSNSADPEQEKSYPLCTIKSFPNQIVHTIHWAMDQFEFFNRVPITINNWIKNSNCINKNDINDIYLLTTKYPIYNQGLIGCVRWALDMFVENYYHSIIKLLTTYPPNHEITPGIKFWSAGKRCPKPIKFDINNSNHFEYIKTTTILLAHMIKNKESFSDKQLYKIIYSLDINYEIINDEIINDNNIEIKTTNNIKQLLVQPFDKDNNYHISWVTTASNMRAENYGIPIVGWYETKGIAGRIIPAISTTTSAVSGLILIEMMKYLLGVNTVENYRSTFINLADPLIVYAEPIKAPSIEINNIKFNSWTKFEYTKNSSLKEFKEHYEKEFNIGITSMIADSNIIYADFLDPDILDKKIIDIFIEVFETLPSNVSINFGTDNDIEFPTINVNIKRE